MRTGIIDVGGGLRGAYAAGVFDYCLDKGIHFDVCIGVSAGSANVAAYMARQKGRNYPFYVEYPFRKKYMSMRNFLLKGSYIDLDYIYGTLSNSDGENPINYNNIRNNPAEMIVVATNAETGEAKYFNKECLKQDCYDIFKASSAIPFICRPYRIKGIPYFDGALSDPVPIQQAFKYGCDKVVLILTRPKNVQRLTGWDSKLALRIQKKYPCSAIKLRKRAELYNRSVDMAKEYEKKGKLLIVAPDHTCGVDTLTKDKEAIRQLYKKGVQDAEIIQQFI